MADDLMAELTASLAEGAGDTEESTPEAPAPETAEETEQPAETPAGDNAPAATPGGDEPLFNSAEFLAAHPELTPYAKQLQADYTKKTQQLAEQRKAAEALANLPEQTVTWVKEFNQAGRDVQLRMLAEAQEQLQGMSAPPPDPLENEWLTDTERQLAEKVQRMEGFIAQQQDSALEAKAQQRFGEMAQKAGIPAVPFEQQALVIQAMARDGIPKERVPDFISRYWLEMYGYDLAVQKGRDEGARTVQQKQGIGPTPGTAPNREREAPQYKTLLEELQAAAALGS